jgi:hypothetical protein
MKKLVVILANCQGGPLLLMLQKYYSHLYDVKWYSNYEYIQQNLDLPEDIKDADIFLYQNYSNTDEKYNLKIILDHKLKKECIKLSFPTLHSCHLLFCYDINAPTNYKTITTEKPHGEFFYGISPIINITNKSNTIHEIIETSKQDNFISEETILYHHNRTFEFLENKCLSSDVPELYDFIKNNFKEVRLWHSPNHPTGILLNYLIKLIFSKLELHYNETEENINILNNGLSDWVMPIFPCVSNYHNFKFDIKCSSWYHKNIIDYDTYLETYIEHLYNNNQQ